MVRLLVVQPDEMLSIQRQNRASIGAIKLKHGFVRQRLIPFARFLDREHIMSQPAKLFDHRERKIFIGVKPGHAQASSFSRIWRSISSRCDRTYPHAFAKSSARRL